MSIIAGGLYDGATPLATWPLSHRPGGESLGIIPHMDSIATIQTPPLNKRSMTELVAKAKRIGIAPGDYAKRLIEDGLELSVKRRSRRFPNHGSGAGPVG